MRRPRLRWARCAATVSSRSSGWRWWPRSRSSACTRCTSGRQRPQPSPSPFRRPRSGRSRGRQRADASRPVSPCRRTAGAVATPRRWGRRLRGHADTAPTRQRHALKSAALWSTLNCFSTPPRSGCSSPRSGTGWIRSPCWWATAWRLHRSAWISPTPTTRITTAGTKPPSRLTNGLSGRPGRISPRITYWVAMPPVTDDDSPAASSASANTPRRRGRGSGRAFRVPGRRR